MRRRFLKGFNALGLIALAASLVLLPLSGALAAPMPEAVVDDSPNGGVTLQQKPENKLIRPAYARSDYAWPFASGPHYGDQSGGQPGSVKLPVGTFNLVGEQIFIPAELTTANKLGQLGAQYFILQVTDESFKNGTFEALTETIRAEGGALMQTLPGGFLVRLNLAGMAAVQNSGILRSVTPYHPAFKLDPSIGRAPHVDRDKAVSSIYDLEVYVFEGEDPNVVAQAIAGLGGNVTAVWLNAVRVEANRDLLPAIAALEPVSMVHEHMPVYPNSSQETGQTMEQGGASSGPNGIQPYTQAGIHGGGDTTAAAQVLMVLDTGISTDAQDFSHTGTTYKSPLGSVATGAGPDHRKVLVYESTNQFGGIGDLRSCDALASGGRTHGHIVSGTAMGNATKVDVAQYGAGIQAIDSTGQKWALDGVAYRAKLVFYDGTVGPPTLACDDEAISAGQLYGGVGTGSLGESYTDHGARLANFSFGASTNVYSGQASQIDGFLNQNRDAMVFISAGNQGADDDGDGRRDEGTLGAPATAKSALAIGATGNVNPGGGDEDDIPFFSSAGPADPGGGERIAPQLMAPGTDFGGNEGLDSEYGCRSLDNTQDDPVECDIDPQGNGRPVEGLSGTSFASPAAMGAAALVRDYFAQGFYPDGTKNNPSNASDRVSTISGALLKSVLIASADWVGEGNALPVASAAAQYRFNNYQGYGRIQLDNALPLATWASSPIGLIVTDGDTPGAGRQDITGAADFNGSIAHGLTDQGTFEVCDTSSELRVALSWVEGSGSSLVNNLDLELVAPSGKVYFGNYFTDDNDRDRVLDAGEDCAPITNFGVPDGSINASPWSLPTCANSIRDDKNPTEGIFLSNDADADGTTVAQGDPDPADDNQLEIGTWTIRVIGADQQTPPGGSWAGPQAYAVAVAGGVCLGSNVRFVQPLYKCKDFAGIQVNEIDDAVNDPAAGLTVAEISSRTFIQVVDPGADGQVGTGDDVLIDEESGFTFTNTGGLTFLAENITLSPETAPDFGNGALDISNGLALKVVYKDESGGVPDPDQERVNAAGVNCQIQIGFGDLVFGNFGLDSESLVDGGCERNGRGQFEFGFPDKYMDADEKLGYRLAFTMDEQEDMADVLATLRCVEADADSPADCLPNSTDCADPQRSNNTACTQMTILNPSQNLGSVTAGSALAANFTLEMASSITGECSDDQSACTTNAGCTSGRCVPPTIEMVMGISAKKSGKSVESLVVSRHKLDADEVSFFYSTDFPSGGAETLDWNNDEVLQNPTTNIGDFNLDYRFENQTWNDLTAGGTRNLGLTSPWDFDVTDEGFSAGRNATSDDVPDIVAYWSEDQNFDGRLNGTCDSDASRACDDYPNDPDNPPSTGCGGLATTVCNAGSEDRDDPDQLLNTGWGSDGGCGWQTNNDGGAAGGIWHTGQISTPGQATCLFDLAASGDCQSAEVLTGNQSNKVVWELLLTQEVQKVNIDADALGDPIYEVEVMDWSWNALVDLPDPFAIMTWELDLDLDNEEPQSLITDGTVLNLFGGAYGAVAGGSNVALTDGYPVFAPLNASRTASQNGTAGLNREGDNGCFFEGGAVNSDNASLLGLSDPPDDEIDQNSGGGIDEFVTDAGPLRNFDLGHFNGPDLRFTTLEDIYGLGGNRMQGAIGFIAVEGNSTTSPTAGFGVAIDDMVLRWREFRLDKDETACSGGACAVIELQTTNFFEGNALLEITVLETSPDNDCDFNGTAGDAADCSGDGIPDVPVEATLTIPIDNERFFVPCVNPVGLTCPDGVYKGTLPISAVFDLDGTLFVQRDGTQLPVVIARYQDFDDGTGVPCPNDVDATAHGEVETTTAIVYPVGDVSIVSVSLTDNGDNDGYADTNETVDMAITVSNKSQIPLTGVVARLTTNSTNIDCIINPIVAVGDLADGETKTTLEKFKFHVGPGVNRAGQFDNLTAVFTVTMSSGEFDALIAPRRITLDLDLNVEGGGAQGNFFETWAGGISNWTPVQQDNGARNNTGSANLRCQYNDPDYVNSNSYGETTCWLGTATATFLEPQNWHAHGDGDLTNAPDGGRGTDDEFSLHWGVHSQPGNADFDTGRPGQLEFIRTTNPINLGHAGAGGTPEMSFKHQVSLVDYRSVNVNVGEAGERGVVHVQLVDGAGTPQGTWQKVYPYQNLYDVQGTDNYIDCLFDPSDDGNDEEDFFDPADPDRRLGPSSTCYPEPSFGFQGDTDYRNPFNATASGAGSDPDKVFPGFSTCTGTCGGGTWMETKFDLSRFQGRRILLRFLATSIELNGVPTYEQGFAPFNPDPRDDGWYIDEVAISPTLATPATLRVDTVDNSLLDACPVDNCGSVTPVLTLDPPSPLATPGHMVELSGEDSTATSCVGGTLQFRFYLDVTPGGGFDGSDVLLRDWTDNPIYMDAPSSSQAYGLEVRCSSDTLCEGFADETLNITCPDSTGTGSFKSTVRLVKDNVVDAGAGSKTVTITANWASSVKVQAVNGDLDALLGTGTYTGTVIGCLKNLSDPATTTFSDTNTIAPGNGIYYVVRGNLCNNFSYGGEGEAVDRDAQIDADGNACP